MSSKKAMATYSSPLAWKIPWAEEPGGLQSMGLIGVGHDWATSLSLFTFMHWRRKWQPTPMILPGKSQGWGEPGGLPSMGSHRVGHDWSDLAAAASWVIRLFLDPLPITDTEALWIGTKVNLKILQFGWWDRIGNPEIGPIHICPVDFWQRCRRSSMEVRSSFVWFSVNCSRTIGHPRAKNNGPPISYKS